MFNFLTSAEYEPGVYILFLLLLIVGIGLLITGLIFRIRKERNSFNELYVDKGTYAMEWLVKYITKIMASANKKTTFYLYQIDIRDYDALKKAIGETQYTNLRREICSILNKLLPWGIRVALKKEDSIVMYVKGNANFDVEGLANLIITNTAKNVELTNALSVDVNVSVAIAGYPSAGVKADEMIKNLELAMVVSRREGYNMFAYYTPQMGNKETDEYKYYQEIKDAMKEKEFTLFYQPVVDTNTLQVTGSESLIRWKHRTMGVLPPSNFLYVMEQTGDINWVGFWCFEEMVKQHLVWRNNYPDNKLIVGINISERQLLNESLADDMRKIVRKHKANPSDYVIEIASFGLYMSSDIAKKNIDRLDEYGFKVALDGFGSEFSSPTKLEQFPLSLIKMDGKFWRKAKDKGITANIVEMVIDYCKDNNIMLITQNVESVEEMMFLRTLGVNFMQGYLFNAPREPREFISDMVMTPWEEKINDEVAKIEEKRALAQKVAEASETKL